MTTNTMLKELMAQNEKILARLDAIDERVSTLEKSGKTSAKKSVSKKSKTSEPKKTWEEQLTEKFGDKEARTKFVELRKKVAEEFSALAKANEIYIPKKSYKKILTETTELLNGKFNKATVKKAFLANATKTK